MKNRTRKVIAASAVAIMLAPAALSALPQNVDAAAVGTVSNTTPVYDANGKATGQTLLSGSSWQLGQQLTINGVAHYQVATNEYIPASVVKNVTGSANSVDSSQSQSRWVEDNPDAGKIATANTTLNVVDAYGNSTGATLPKSTQWKIGSQTLHYDKQTFYQVATNEFVSVAYMNIVDQTSTTPNTNTNSSVPTPSNGLIATTNKQIRTYNTSTNSYDLTLPANSAWKISKLVVNKYGSYWGQVATNQWVWITDVTLNSGLNLKANSYYEPEFATSINK